MQTHASAALNKTLEEFITELSLTKSKLTVAAYQTDVANFLHYLAQKQVKRPGSIRQSHLLGHLGQCKQNGRSDSTINRYYMSIRSYCRYLRRSKTINFDFTEDVSPPRAKQATTRVPTVQEIERILDQPDVETESGLRDRAMLELLYSSGLRASELCALMIQDAMGHQVRVICGKRGKTRTIPVNSTAAKWIKQYIELYRGEGEGYLFLTQLGRKITRVLLAKIVRNYAKKAGVEEVTTHTLRHACATHLLDEGADLRMIQEVLGHSSIASTQRYTHLSSSKIQEMFQHFHPRKAG